MAAYMRSVVDIVSVLHLVPLIAANGNKAHNTFIRYSYTDGDPLGPENWNKLPDGEATTNFCAYVEAGEDESFMTPGTPLNILTSQATLPIRDIEEEFELDMKKPSLSFRVRKDIENLDWEFGYPTDSYHGIELRAPRLGLLTLIDSYDPVGTSIAYDFHFAFISFCDFSKVGKDRTSHQLDGKRFPLEINMMFFSQPRDIGMDNNLYPLNNESSIIMVSVLGEIGSEDNKLLEPLLKAAESYNGGDWDMDDTDDKFSIKIKTPFSPSWLLPLESQYFYYSDGTYPVPPCFPITQVYVFKTPIKISAGQLKKFTNLRTEREPNKTFACTFGLLRNEIPPSKINYNPYPIRIFGSDGRQEKQEEDFASSIRPQEYVGCLLVFMAVLIS